MQLFDSHAHYNDERFDIDRDTIINEIYEAGVTKLVNAGYNIESSKKAIDMAGDYDFVYATCGISPNDIKEIDEQDYKVIKELAKSKKIVAIGEIGLDYYWNKDNKDLQKEVFVKQIQIANELNLPIVIHTREAVMDTLDILKSKMPAKLKGVFHCCPLNIELVKEALKLQYYISIAGPITFKNSKNAEEIVKMIPLDKILIETDSPYLSPEPVRGTRNDSRNIKYIAEKIAQIKKLDINQIAEATYKNTERVFNI